MTDMDKMTMRDYAKRCGVTYECVRRTVNKELKTLIPNTFIPNIVLKEEKYKTNEIKCLGNKKLWE